MNWGKAQSSLSIAPSTEFSSRANLFWVRLPELGIIDIFCFLALVVRWAPYWWGRLKICQLSLPLRRRKLRLVWALAVHWLSHLPPPLFFFRVGSFVYMEGNWVSLFQASLGYFPALQEVWSGESFELGRLMWVVDLFGHHQRRKWKYQPNQVAWQKWVMTREQASLVCTEQNWEVLGLVKLSSRGKKELRGGRKVWEEKASLSISSS